MSIISSLTMVRNFLKGFTPNPSDPTPNKVQWMKRTGLVSVGVVLGAGLYHSFFGIPGNRAADLKKHVEVTNFELEHTVQHVKEVRSDVQKMKETVERVEHKVDNIAQQVDDLKQQFAAQQQDTLQLKASVADIQRGAHERDQNYVRLKGQVEEISQQFDLFKQMALGPQKK